MSAHGIEGYSPEQPELTIAQFNQKWKVFYFIPLLSVFNHKNEVVLNFQNNLTCVGKTLCHRRLFNIFIIPLLVLQENYVTSTCALCLE